MTFIIGLFRKFLIFQTFFTDGRYDTPQHFLYRSLTDEHKDDFYQPCEPSIKANTGPRMPWQDIHVKLEGPAARDIMMNFVER